MDFDRLAATIPEWRMESVSHTLVRPQTNPVYAPESQVRRGLAARDIMLDERIRDDFDAYDATFLADHRGDLLPGPSHWAEITHIGLSPEGDIRMLDVSDGGRVVLKDDVVPREFEVFVIRTNHSKYRLALSRVLMLLPGLRPGAGMVRLAPPVQAPWPFFDYDFAMAPFFRTIEEVNRNFGTRDSRLVFVSISAPISTAPPYGEWPVEGVSHPQIWDFGWDANGDVLLCCGLQRESDSAWARVVLRLPASHAQHGVVLAELRRVQPGLRRGAGFTHTPVFAPPPWPFAPFEGPVDRKIAEAIAAARYSRPFDPPPPPIPAPTAQD